MKPLDYLLPNTIGPQPNSLLEQMKLDAINSLLSFNSQNTSERLQDISEIVSNSTQSNKPIGFKDLNGLIESLLVWLLNTPYIFINSQGTEGLTPHFIEYIQGNNSIDNIVPYSIASLIQDGCTYTWGGFYGTLAFELYLNRTQNHYLSTSQLVDIVTRNLLNRLINTSLGTIHNITQSLLNVLSTDALEVDIQIYRFGIDIIQSLSSVGSSIALIEYLVSMNDLIHMNSLINVREEFKDIYQDLYISLINYPISNTLKTFDIFHTNINQSTINASNKIHEWCLKTNTLIQNTNHIELINLSSRIQDVFRQNNSLNPLVQIKRDLVSLPLPGGFNQLLILSALILLHRAYIMSHPSKLPNTLLKSFQEIQGGKYDSLTYSSNTFMDQVLSRQEQEGLFSRVMSLLYLAGRNLRKTNIRDYILMGNNINYISGWRDTDNTNITALID